jgi:hypothetical protein
MESITSFWTIVVFVGAFALMGAILWAKANNRTSRAKLEKTEAATARIYEQGDTVDRTKS